MTPKTGRALLFFLGSGLQLVGSVLESPLLKKRLTRDEEREFKGVIQAQANKIRSLNEEVADLRESVESLRDILHLLKEEEERRGKLGAEERPA